MQFREAHEESHVRSQTSLPQNHLQCPLLAPDEDRDRSKYIWSAPGGKELPRLATGSASSCWNGHAGTDGGSSGNHHHARRHGQWSKCFFRGCRRRRHAHRNGRIRRETPRARPRKFLRRHCSPLLRHSSAGNSALDRRRHRRAEVCSPRGRSQLQSRVCKYHQR